MLRKMKPASRPQYYRIKRIVDMVREGCEEGYLPNRGDFRRELEVSPSTLPRDLDFLRDIVFLTHHKQGRWEIHIVDQYEGQRSSPRFSRRFGSLSACPHYAPFGVESGPSSEPHSDHMNRANSVSQSRPDCEGWLMQPVTRCR